MADFVHIEHPTSEDPLNDKSNNARPTPLEVTPAKPDLRFLDVHPFVRQTVIDRVYGCIIGSALGDTIGLYTEFLPKHACETIYKERAFRLVEPTTEWYPDSHRNRFEKCAWTDDTDQAILILLAYLQAQSSPDALKKVPQSFASRLQIWCTQGLRALDRPPCGIGALVGSVTMNPDYLKDPVDIATKRWLKTRRHAAPNGSLMRTHPIGVICVGLSEVETWNVATEVGRTTHVDPRCVVACCISVGLIRGMIRGEILSEGDVDKAIERAYSWVFAQPELMNPGLDPDITEWEIKRHLERKEFERHVYATNLPELQLDSAMEMGYIYKCLGSALVTLRKAIRASKMGSISPPALFEELITDLIMEGGDSDTNGAAAGALLGAWVDYSNLPPHWSNGLAHKEWLISKTRRLTQAVGIIEGTVAEVKDEAPDGGKGLMTEKELEQRDRDFLFVILQKDKERKEKEERERRKSQGKGLAGWFKK
ncbi:ADP-ribosylglycohydrolase [Lindgomyces ingoldianus]|uniref:ADP-ribosylglycohydrolase n=1 Tax=Lindgomyces ingoldianus TaxID=673940 RepID=A0ACB6R185_9PLEO|nr:ADP-ribosylglycohydrolase [Lindgomyces ingoldianus]KAF2473009.1 ADP-ribosylglycohydrolase [Lindgomyces ingoldianus]